MSDARKILDQLAAQREHDEQEMRRWDAYRKLCGPPRWFLAALGVFGLASMVLLAEALLVAGNRESLDNLGRIGLALYVVFALPFAVYLEKRRRKGLKKILQQEAPELAAKLAEERILR
ncbi:MAG TPA: hypothetical protein VK163_08000 [Opitutaceae bacterium]|nr:hypothetical protein [Opitutaceae bacterium]